MFELTTLLAIIFIILLSNKIYFLIFKEKVVFFKYFKFLTLCLIIVLTTTIIFLKLNDTNRVNQDFFQSSVIVYVLLSLFMLFNITTKSYESPTVIIHDTIKTKGASRKKIFNILKKKQLIKIRFSDLLKQKLIKKKNSKFILTPLGYKFGYFFSLLKSFFKIKCKG